MSDTKVKAVHRMRTVSLVVEFENVPDYTVKVRVTENDAKGEENPEAPDLIIWALWTPLPDRNISGEKTGETINYTFTFTFDKDGTEYGTLAWDGGHVRISAPHWKRIARHAFNNSQAIRNKK